MTIAAALRPVAAQVRHTPGKHIVHGEEGADPNSTVGATTLGGAGDGPYLRENQPAPSCKGERRQCGKRRGRQNGQ